MTIALTIAGSDPSGGAGLQADIKTMHSHGVFATSVVTLLTVQNTCGVDDVRLVDPDFAIAQLNAVLSDLPPMAAKTGALGSAAMIESIATRADQFAFPLVVDPVMISKHGHALVDDDAVNALRDQLLPKSFLVTPNTHEASALTGIQVTDIDSMVRAARLLCERGAKHVLIKGGQATANATDVLWISEGASSGGASQGKHELVGQYFDTDQTHGSGCVMSAAITARLALGHDLISAITMAKDFVTRAIKTAPAMGHGIGPLNMHAGV